MDEHIKNKMKAALWTGYGGPETLKVTKTDIPDVKKDEILVKVINSSVTMGDVEMRSLRLPLLFRIAVRLFFGLFKPRRGILGQEFSGIVEECGSSVADFKPGDEVFGQTGFSMGAYARYMKINEKEMITKKPAGVTHKDAACLPLGGLESWNFLKKAGISENSRILVIGGGGSIGTIGIQLAKMLGAYVAAVDTAEKFDVMTESGADSCIDYKKEDYLNSGVKYDAVLDVAGKIPLKKGFRLLSPEGVYMHTNPRIRQVMFKGMYKPGGRKHILFKDTEQDKTELHELCKFMEGGKIRPIIDKSFFLDDIVLAHEYVGSGRKKGAVSVVVAD